MTAILHKALAGDLHQRYVSASAFESDVTLFLQAGRRSRKWSGAFRGRAIRRWRGSACRTYRSA